MKYTFTRGGLAALEELLAAEALAAKKARLYSKSLSEPSAAARAEGLAARHAARYGQLLALLCEQDAQGGGGV